jgi:Domain of unknown function (DUF4349)
LSPDLATTLREETPAAPSELRERIAYITATAPPPRRTPSLRRILVWSGPAALTASCLAALVVGLSTALDAGRVDNENAARSIPPVSRNLERQFKADSAKGETRERREAQPSTLSPALAPESKAAVPGPTPNRAQNVQASLRILVDDPDDLSAATQRALRTTRRLGGYLVTVNYGTPEPTEGTANLRVKIPVSRVQAAIVEFNELGRILAQQTQITDLQQRLDELTRQIRRAKGDKARITALRRERTVLNRRAAYATVDLGLTTHEPEAQATPPGRFDRAVDDATGVLKAELAIGASILIVASPFLVLLAAALAGSRAYRRYADQRLLERA